MNPIIMISIIGCWLLYSLLIKLTKKRKYDYSIVVAFVFLVGLGYYYFYLGFDDSTFVYFTYAGIAVYAIWMIIDNVTLLFKKNVSEFDFHDLEAKLEYVSEASELVRQRFISTIELLHDGISFREGEHIFGTDKFVEITGVKDNEITVTDYENLMIKEDLVQYRLQLEKISKKYPTYTIKYRLEKEGKTIWVVEHGKMIIIDKKRSYISIIKNLDIKHYPQTDIDVLNNVENATELKDEMQRLSRTKTPYHLVLIQLTNIPIINEKYGRDFGDLMMGEYLSKLRFKFIKDSKSLFRITGIKFALLIKDKSKFSLLDRALVGSGELFTLQMKFGGVSQTIYPNLGISESPYEGKSVQQVYQEADQALALTFKEGYGKTYCFYNDK